MISRNIIIILLLFGIVEALTAQNQKTITSFQVDAQNYFAGHDIVYQSPPCEGFEGFPVGNGDLGGMIWTTPRGIKIQLNKSDAFDVKNDESPANLRSCGQLDIDFGEPCFDWLYLKDFEGRLSLYRAEASFLSETPVSKTTVNSFVAINKNVWLIECARESRANTEQAPFVKIGLERWGSRAFAGWYSGHNTDPGIGLGQAKAGTEGELIYLAEQFDGMHFAMACKVLGIQTGVELNGERRAEIKTEKLKSGSFTILLSVVTSLEADNPLDAAKNNIRETKISDIPDLKKQHKNWWHAFWERSFVHLPNNYIENIYYLKRYILASSSRGDYPTLFNGSIFTWNHDVRNWVTPHHWNMQQIYWGILPSGDHDLLQPYLNAYFRMMPQAEKYALERGASDAILWSEPHDFAGNMVGGHRSDMVNNYTPASQMASFFWDYYKYTGDISFLKEKGYPFMNKAAEFYLKKLQWDDGKGEYYLFPSQPYENPQANNLRNCITDRGMIEATFENCVQASRILNVDKGKQKQWLHVVENLWNAPTIPVKYFDKQEWSGYKIHSKIKIPEHAGDILALGYKADGAIYPDSAEAGDWVFHFSAPTSPVFPANLIGLDDKGTPWFKASAKAVAVQPVYRNAINPNPIVAARLGMGNEALKMITNSIRRLQQFPQGMFYNLDHWYGYSRYADSLQSPEYSAMRDYIYDSRAGYKRGGSDVFVPAKPFVQFGLEPLGIIGAAVNEMLLQSVEGKIRVLPAIPEAWKNEELAFKLWAEKGFEVSVFKKSSGEIQPVLIKSKLGNTCVMVNPWENQKIVVKSVSTGKMVKVKSITKQVFSFQTKAGESYQLKSANYKNAKERTFTGTKNNSPKYFDEAVLGKGKSF
jgi:hypothetical protein